MSNSETQTEQKGASGTETKISFKQKTLKAVGFSSTGLGTFGAVHNVCHYTCQAAVALLAIAGISVAGMPLGFLLNPYLIIAFSAIGLISIALSIVLQVQSSKLSGRRVVNDKKFLIAIVFGILSMFSLVSGANDIRAGQRTASVSTGGAPPSEYTLAVDTPTKTNSEGAIEVTLVFKGLSQEGLLFAVALNTYDMNAPPLAEQYDLKELSRLIFDGKTTVHPVRLDIEETGHMGHHLKGTLLFPYRRQEANVVSDPIKVFEILIKNLGGVDERKFLWKVIK